MLTSSTYRLGPWTFVPSAHELRSGTAVVRLEQRASLTLSLLCQRNGEVVSQSEIVERVWNRPHLSPNSVAVVIGDLRRALNLPAGAPGSIETVPKAGYRIVPGSEPPQHEKRRPWVVLGIALALLGAAIAFFSTRDALPALPTIAIGQIDDQMNAPEHTAFMRACSAQVLLELGKYAQPIEVPPGGSRASGASDYQLIQRWVFWTGDPELVIVVRDTSGKTIWSGEVYGPQGQFPAKIAAQMEKFGEVLRKRSAG